MNDDISAGERGDEIAGSHVSTDPANFFHRFRWWPTGNADNFLDHGSSHNAASNDVPRLPVAPVTATRTRSLRSPVAQRLDYPRSRRAKQMPQR